jgi:hypothetical protein
VSHISLRPRWPTEMTLHPSRLTTKCSSVEGEGFKLSAAAANAESQESLGVHKVVEAQCADCGRQSKSNAVCSLEQTGRLEEIGWL